VSDRFAEPPCLDCWAVRRLMTLMQHPSLAAVAAYHERLRERPRQARRSAFSIQSRSKRWWFAS